MSASAELSIRRFGTGQRIAGTLLLAAGVIFFGVMASLVSHESELRCDTPGECMHVERYPFGIENAKAMPEISRALTRWSPGSRSMAIKLVLTHRDGTESEYHGVGTNGDRAQAVAEAINASLENAEAPRVFHLRDRSIPMALMMLLMALSCLVLCAAPFSMVHLRVYNGVLSALVQHRPMRSRECHVPLAGVRGTTLTQLASMNVVAFKVCLDVVDGAPFDLGLSASSEVAARAKAAEVDAWLQSHLASLPVDPDHV